MEKVIDFPKKDVDENNINIDENVQKQQDTFSKERLQWILNNAYNNVDEDKFYPLIKLGNIDGLFLDVDEINARCSKEYKTYAIVFNITLFSSVLSFMIGIKKGDNDNIIDTTIGVKQYISVASQTIETHSSISHTISNDDINDKTAMDVFGINIFKIFGLLVNHVDKCVTDSLLAKN